MPATANEALIYRFMIDRREQGRGYGRAALTALLDEIRALGHVRDVLVGYMPENEGARRLYGRPDLSTRERTRTAR